MNHIKTLDEVTLGSGSASVSGLSDLSAMGNETDELGRKILQHQRQTQQHRQEEFATRQPFYRSEGLSIADALARGPRSRGATSLRRPHNKTGASNRDEQELPVVQQWGSKGRTSVGWMRQIQDTSAPDDNESAGPVREPGYTRRIDQIYARRSRLSRRTETEVMAPAHTNSQSLPRENTSPPRQSIPHLRSGLMADKEPESEEFSSASLLASTPAPHRLTRNIDAYSHRRDLLHPSTRRDTQNNSDVNHHDQDINRRRASRPEDYERLVTGKIEAVESIQRPSTSHESLSIGSRIPRWMRSPDRNKENQAPKEGNGLAIDDPIAKVHDKNAETITRSDSARPEYQPSGDALSLLRRLARVHSMSPSPGKVHDALSQSKDNASSKLDGEPVLDKHAVPVSRISPALAEVNDIEPSSHTRSHQHPVKEDSPKSGKKSTGHTSNDSHEPAPSPVTTGAWINSTPQDKVSDKGTFATNSDSDGAAHDPQSPSLRAALTNSKSASKATSGTEGRSSSRPRSGLADIMNEAKAGDGTQTFGESTILSLEDIVSPDIDAGDPTITFDLDEWREVKQDTDRNPARTKKTHSRERLKADEAKEHLQAAKTTLRDAKAELRRVAQRPDLTDKQASHTRSNVSATASTKASPLCVKCGLECHTMSIWWALLLEFCSLFCTWDHSSSSSVKHTWSHLRLTRLSVVVLLSLAWFVTESTLCAYHCHPLYARSMIDYGVDPDAPDFPFVIPTLIFRPFRWIWKPVVHTLANSVTSLLPTFFGAGARDKPYPLSRPITEQVGKPIFSGQGRQIPSSSLRRTVMHETANGWFGAATRATVRAAASAVDAFDELGRMWDDEAV